MSSQQEHGPAEDKGASGGYCDPQRDTERERQARCHCGAAGVSPDAEEHTVAEGVVTGDADDDVEALRHDHVHKNRRQHPQPIGTDADRSRAQDNEACGDGDPHHRTCRGPGILLWNTGLAHACSPKKARPNRPCGRTTSTPRNIAKATISWKLVPRKYAAHDWTRP